MAVTTVTSLNACLNLVRPLEDIVGSNSPEMVREDVAILSALNSTANTAGLEAPTVTRRGQTLTVNYDYFEPNCAPQTEACPDFCSLDVAATASPKRSVSFDLGECSWRAGALNYEEFRGLCETPDEVKSFQLMNAASEIIKDMATNLYGKMAAQVGNYPGSGNPSATSTCTLNLIGADGDVNKAAFVSLNRAFSRHGKRPIIIGGQTLGTAKEILNISANAGGLNYDANAIIAGSPIYSDYKIDDVLQGATNDSFALAFVPGAFRLAEGYMNEGIFEIMNDPRITRTTIEIYNTKFDLYTEFDPKCNKFTWLLKKEYDLFALPSDVYQDCQDYVSSLLYKVGCGAWDCTQLSC